MTTAAAATAQAGDFQAHTPGSFHGKTLLQGARRVMMEDPAAEHQIVVRMGSEHRIVVSCTCLRDARSKGRPYYEPIEDRVLFPAPELWAAWADWHLTGGTS